MEKLSSDTIQFVQPFEWGAELREKYLELSRIAVESPTPENIATLFEFLDSNIKLEISIAPEVSEYMALNLNCLIVGNHPFSTPAVRVPHGESEISFIFRQWMFQRAVKGSKTIARPDGFREFSQATGRAELPTDVKGTDFITETLRQHPTFLFPEGGANFLRQDEDYKKYKIGTSFIYTCSNVGQNYVILMAISDTPNHTQKIELFGLLDVSERVGEDKKAGINRITQEFADRIVSCKIGSSF